MTYSEPSSPGPSFTDPASSGASPSGASVQPPYPAPTSSSYPAPATLDGPPNNIGWAVAALVCFWPLAFHAFGAATRVDRAWLSGQPELAAQESLRARKLGQIALWIAVGLIAAYILLLISIAVIPFFIAIGTIGTLGSGNW